MLSAEREAEFVLLLGHVYRAINWRKLGVGKNPWDVWNHRVRAAATRGTLGEAISRLSNFFGIQSLPAEAVALVEALRPDQEALLDLAYREHIPIAMRAVLEARKLKGVAA